MTDWASIIDARRRVKALVEGYSVVGDLLDTPPAAGAERGWLQSLLDEAKGLISKIGDLAKSEKQKAEDAAKILKGGLEKAAEAAKEHAGDFAGGFLGAAGDLAKFLATNSIIALLLMLGILYFYTKSKEK